VPNHEQYVSIADLALAGVDVKPREAVTIVRELALRVARNEFPGVPSAHVIRLFASGLVKVEGPVAADSRAVARAAHLLETLLPPVNAPADMRAPGALRLVLARALGTLDLPPYPSLDSFAQALARFGSDDAEATVRILVARYALATSAGGRTRRIAAPRAEGGAGVYDLTVRDGRAGGPQESPLTVSDIRRARRATGLTLSEIADRSHISHRLLRELEWGYVRNWPGTPAGRSQLVSYATAAGLDGDLVVRTVWPLIEESARARGVTSIETITIPYEPSVIPRTPVTSLARIPSVVPAPRRGTRQRLLAALAIPALLAISVTPVVWQWSGSSDAANVPAGSAPAALSTPALTNDGSSRPVVAAGLGSVGERVETSDQEIEAAPALGISDGPTYSPAFASVGSAMFYHAEAGSHSSLMRAETDGRGAVLRITSIVDDRSHNYHVRPSPDGTQIAFDSDRDGERAVYVANADGRDVRRISGDGFAAVPSWSPDGRTIAFVRAEPDRRKVWNLWTVDLSTGATRRLTAYPYGQLWGGSWFPDGERIAYSHELRLVVLDLASGKKREYRSPMKGQLVRTPAVSPDGARVVFQVLGDGAWMLELSNGSMRRVLRDPSAEEYTWSPDGRRVAYHSRSAGKWGVWVMAAN
jgi:Tol biopolymer transport system component